MNFFGPVLQAKTTMISLAITDWSNITQYGTIGEHKQFKEGSAMPIRFATQQDIPSLLRIYAQYIDTAITFESILPSEQEFAHRMADIAEEYPCLVCETAGRVVGYAYAHRHMERAAYQWNAELSIYIDPSFVSKGLGRTFYEILIEILKLQEIRTVYGGVTIPNEKSERLHLSLGFHPIGTYHKAGHKRGQWHDVTWFEKEITPYLLDPPPFLPVNQISREALEHILKEQGQLTLPVSFSRYTPPKMTDQI